MNIYAFFFWLKELKFEFLDFIREDKIFRDLESEFNSFMFGILNA